MDSRMDLQRLLEDMDKVVQAKRAELSELDERLEQTRGQLARKEAQVEEELQVEGLSRKRQSVKGNALEPFELLEQFSLVEGKEELEKYLMEQKEVFEQQMGQMSEELTELETLNKELAKENGLIRLELDKNKNSVKQLEDNNRMHREALKEAHEANFELNMRLAKAESELKMQSKLLRKTHEEDELLMDTFSDKLESLKRALKAKDDQIKRLKLDAQSAFQSLGLRDGRSRDESQNGRPLIKHDDGDGNGHDSWATLEPDNDGNSVIEIVNVLREKDSQIELLKSQLLQATKDLEQNASIIENLCLSGADQFNLADRASSRQVIDDESQVRAVTKENNEQLAPSTALGAAENAGSAKRCAMLESELELKDRQLHWFELKNHHYETILPNLISDLLLALARAAATHRDKQNNSNNNENNNNNNNNNDDTGDGDDRFAAREPPVWLAERWRQVEWLISCLRQVLSQLDESRALLEQIELLKGQNEAKAMHIKQLVAELNRNGHPKAAAAAAAAAAEAAAIKMAGKEPAEAAEPPAKPVGSPQIQSAGLMSSGLAADLGEPRAVSSESDGHAGRTTGVIVYKAAIGDTGEPSGLDAITGTSRSSETDQPVVQKVDKYASKQTQTQSSAEMVDSAGQCGELASHLLGEQAKLKQLEIENQLLELAMKEILWALKESDAQCSTILIDCPSLERLCQLIEARHLAGLVRATPSGAPDISPEDVPEEECEMFQLLVLKSELDLVRGQNEQLRSQAKIQRTEFMNLLSASHNEISQIYAAKYEQLLSAGKVEDRVSEMCDSGCQTELCLDLTEVEPARKRPVCNNCSRWLQLTGHLFQCIARIEVRLGVSNELCLGRLLALSRLVSSIELDLANRDEALSECRRQCQHLLQSNQLAEARIQTLEQQMLTYQTMSKFQHGLIPTSNRNVILQETSVQAKLAKTEPNKTGSQQRLTISLLQSIIGCLQARLDYKDDRMKQLEELLIRTLSDHSVLIKHQSQ